jgi:NitT/TauT family transport system substrate-binding protein
MPEGGKPTPAFYGVVAVVVLALVGFAIWRSDIFAPKAAKKAGGDIDLKELEKNVEAPDATNVTTVKEYVFKPAERLPPVKGVSEYKTLDKERTVRFAINVWAGWGPIILANNGFKAGQKWKTPDGKEFQVELVLIDDPVAMQDVYASGDVHVGWATLDMVPLFMERFVDKSGRPKDSKIMPRIFQQVDWSNGGDGIVVREAIKTVGDLRGKKVVLAQNSPSHYFALNMLVLGGVQPSEVQMVFTQDAFQAAAAFNAQKDILGCVSWAPDIYNLEKVRGNRMLVTTAQANKLIADVWFARADFARDHPDIVEGLVRSIFDSMVELKEEANRKKLAGLMAKGYNIPETDALSMQGDAHNTNWAENYQFFVNQNNPTNFERIWQQAYLLYRRVGSITHQPVGFDQVMDFSLIEKLGKEDKYAKQKDEYRALVTPRTVSEIRGAEQEILTNTIFVRFFPNNWDLYKKITKQVGDKTVEELYEPNVDLVLEEVAKLAGQFGAARIVIEGHTDSSMKGQITGQLVKELSLNRANAVMEALLKKYPELDRGRFAVEGLGWDRPADSNDPNNHARNRRVEVKVFTAEKT